MSEHRAKDQPQQDSCDSRKSDQGRFGRAEQWRPAAPYLRSPRHAKRKTQEQPRSAPARPIFDAVGSTASASEGAAEGLRRGRAALGRPAYGRSKPA